jgi:hypothetical protein
MFTLVCCQQQQEQDQNDKPDLKLSELQFQESQIALVGEASDLVSTWKEYQEFQTAMENFDHKARTAASLAILVQNLAPSLPAQLDAQRIRSRIKVMETRIKSYASYLNYTTRTASGHEQRYNDFILTVDQFKNQLNEKAQFDRIQRDILEELKEDLAPVNSNQPADSIP